MRLSAVELFALAIIILVTVVLASHPVIDVDLGWHLAGGLWTLEHRAVPVTDPFASGAHPWIAYSWLPEILIASAFQYFGWEILGRFQLFLAILSVLVGYGLMRGGQRRGNHASSLGAVVATLLLILFLAPVWHLRPQLMSIILFMVALYLAESRQLRIVSVVVLSIPWANIHIFWLFLPVVVFAYRVIPPLLERRRSDLVTGAICVAAALLSGVMNPYGFGLFRAAAEYALRHSAAEGLIREFQPLTPQLGLMFVSYLVIIGMLTFSWRRLLSQELLPLTLLTALFGGLALSQIKYLAPFGVVAIVLLTRSSFPTFFHLLLKQSVSIPAACPSSATYLAIGILLLLPFFIPPPEVAPRYKELLSAASLVADNARCSEQGSSEEVPILNHFDDGGWLALGFQLARTSEVPTRCLVTIDGRTLVMGEERLREFQRLRAVEPGWCKVIERWSPKYAVLPTRSRITKALREGKDCPTWTWDSLSTGEHLTVLKRRSLSPL